MKGLIRKIFRKTDNSKAAADAVQVKDINKTTNAVFNQYKKSFKDLARYDREGEVPAN